MIDFTALDLGLASLKSGLDSGNADFDAFVTESHQYLSNTLPAYKLPPMMEILTTFAYHLLWTTFLATLAGFAVGFIIGIWSGPGAFVTAALGASAAAHNTLLTAGALGLIKAGYETQTLFRPANSAREDIHNFVFDIKHPITTIYAEVQERIARCGFK